MAENEGSFKRPFAVLGMAAASFAAFLVTASAEHPDPAFVHAARCFAIGIPLSVFGAMLLSMDSEAEGQGLKIILFLFRMVSSLAGNITCAVGLYWVFRHVSGTAGRDFLITILISAALMFPLTLLLINSSETIKNSRPVSGSGVTAAGQSPKSGGDAPIH